MAVVLAATGMFLYLRVKDDLSASLDQGLRTRADEVAALVRNDPVGLGDSGGSRLVEEDESFTQVIGPRGEVIDASTRRLDARPVLNADRVARARRDTLLFDDGPPPGYDDSMRVLARPVQSRGRTVVVVVANTRDDRDEALSSLRTVLLTGGPVALLLASLAGYALASAALRPVESMRRRAAEISRLGTGRRLPVPAAKDELAQLGETLNEMLGRLERSVERERGFVANASHELRTPLALLKGELELALRAGRSPEELRAAISSAAEESDRLIQLAEDLLVLARSDQGELAVRAGEVDAEELLARVRRRFEVRAGEAGRTLRVKADGTAPFNADLLRVEQALANLVDNALRHGGGEVALTAEQRDGTVELHVLDEGPGFPPGFLPNAFERFARADPARARGGAGLGLAIVQAIALAHGGEAHAQNRAERGADIWIVLPRRPS